MKLFLGLIGSLVVATALVIGVHAAMPGATRVQWHGADIDWVGNLSFALLISVFVLRVWSVRLLSIGTALAVPAFLLVVAGIVFLGGMVLERSLMLGLLMISPVGTIGYYPVGADMPLEGGLQHWAPTALVSVALGLLLGAGLRRLRRRGHGPRKKYIGS